MAAGTPLVNDAGVSLAFRAYPSRFRRSLRLLLTRREFLVLGAGSALGACGASRSSAYSGVTQWGSEGLRDGSFLRPRAIGVHGGRVYVVDTTGRVQIFDRDGVFLGMWKVPESDNGTPTAVAFGVYRRDGTGARVLIPDTHYSRILEYSPEGELLEQWGSYGQGEGQFVYPTGIVESPSGLFYISEYGEDAEQVQVYDAERRYLRQWGSHGGDAGQFNRAMAIAMGPSEVLYVADTTNHRVQCFDTEGKLLLVIGEAGEARGQLKFPHDIAVAPDGSLLVCEYGAHRISRFEPDGRFVGAFGGPGRAAGMFNSPRGVAVSEQGEVYVADTDNHRIQRFPLELIS